MTASFVKRVKAASLRRFRWQITKVHKVILFKITFVVVLSIEGLVQIAVQ